MNPKVGEELLCKRCGHAWNARIARRPVQCPRCKSPAWDQPLQVGEAKAEYRPQSKKAPAIRRGGRQDIDFTKLPSFGIWADRTETDEELLGIMKAGWGKAPDDE